MNAWWVLKDFKALGRNQASIHINGFEGVRPYIGLTEQGKIFPRSIIAAIRGVGTATTHPWGPFLQAMI